MRHPLQRALDGRPLPRGVWKAAPTSGTAHATPKQERSVDVRILDKGSRARRAIDKRQNSNPPQRILRMVPRLLVRPDNRSPRQTMVSPVAPPDPLAETPPLPPMEGAVWIEGFGLSWEPNGSGAPDIGHPKMRPSAKARWVNDGLWVRAFSRELLNELAS